jgi:hypothetical protein
MVARSSYIRTALRGDSYPLYSLLYSMGAISFSALAQPH